MNLRPGHWGVAFVLALGLHSGVIWAALSERQEPQGAKAQGVGGLEISISMLAAASGAEAAQESLAGDEPVPEETNLQEPELVEPEPQKPPEPVVETESEPEPTPEPITPESPVEVAVEPPHPEPVVEEAVQQQEPPKPESALTEAKPLPKPKRKPEVARKTPPKPEPDPVETTPAETPKPALKAEVKSSTNDQPPRQEQLARASQGAVEANNNRATSAATLSQSGGGKVVGKVKPDYATELRRWLERHKTYPKSAKRRRHQGVVILAFSLRRDGIVLDHRIRKGSGFESLDEETIAMLKRAQPLPPFPDDMDGEILKIALPIQFSLR